MTAKLQNYHDRMQRTLDYIDQNLENDLDLEMLSAVAAFSKFHFHRQFIASFGLSAHRYVQLARMKRASYRLAYRGADSITEIAMDSGYDAPDAFARAFRQRFSQSPSSFRKSPDWEQWLLAFGPFANARSKLMQKTFNEHDVTIQDVPPTQVAIMQHRGNPKNIGTTIQRFIAWRKRVGLPPKVSTTFTVYHDDPGSTPADEFRMDLCAATEQRIVTNDENVVMGEIPGGRCAVLRVIGMSDNLEPAALFLYRDWLPDSGEETREFPLYCQRISFYPDVPEQESITDLFLPLR